MVSDEHARASENERTYFLDAESATEMARLMHQDRLLTQALGGALPEQPDLSRVERILDIGCGPGGWVLEVARTHPQIQVVGCDISQTMIEYARAQARTQGLANADFLVMNALQGLAFPSESFDLVNARLIGGFVPRMYWPRLIEECRRITRPQGRLRLTECEASFTTSPACTRLTHLFTSALHRAGMSFSPDGSTIGLTPMLPHLLRQGGYEAIGYRGAAIEYSSGTEFHNSAYQDMLVASRLMQPFLLRMGVTTQKELEQVYEQALAEMLQEDFCAIWYYLTVWGEKPASR
jgi:ubiquinone/menaquinone biosynthesis C-methylase UbiE